MEEYDINAADITHSWRSAAECCHMASLRGARPAHLLLR